MKIVHITNFYVPNLGYQENFLPSEQKKCGHDVSIITSDRAPSYTGYEKHVGKIIGDRVIGVGTCTENGVTIYRLPTIYEVEDGGQVLLRGLYKLLVKLNPDVVHAHVAFSPLTVQAILYSRKLKYRVFVDDHSNVDNFHLTSLIKKLYVQLVKAFYYFFGDRVEMFFPVTYATTDLLKRVLKVPEQRLALLPLSANTDRFNKSLETRRIGRNKLGIGGNEKLIVTAGKLDEQKDIEYLIKAINHVIERKPLIKLLIIGNGTQEYMSNLKSLVNRLKLTDKVVFMDFVPNKELPKYYNAGDIGVWPGTNSITAIEAAATGLPLVLPDHDLAYKILFNNQAAVGFKRRNVKSLANAILDLLDNSELSNQIVNNSSRLFTETLSWKGIAQKSIDTYKSALKV